MEDGKGEEGENGSHISVTVKLPDGDEIVVEHLMKAEAALAVRQVLAEVPKVCFHTAYELRVARTGEVLNPYLEISHYLESGALEDGDELEMVMDEYDERGLRLHLRRCRELLAAPPAGSIQNIVKQREVRVGQVKVSHPESQNDGGDNKEDLNSNENEKGKRRKGRSKSKKPKSKRRGKNVEDEPLENGANEDTAKNGEDLPKETDDNDAGKEVADDKQGDDQESLLMKHRQAIEKNIEVAKSNYRRVQIPLPSSLQWYFNFVLGTFDTDNPDSWNISLVSQTAVSLMKGDSEQGGSRLSFMGNGHTKSAQSVNTACIKGIKFSGWNPPPPARRMIGDLAYLEVTSNDDQVIHLTGTTMGFYVNNTNYNHFDPTPAVNSCFSHSILGVLVNALPSFVRTWEASTISTTRSWREFDNTVDFVKGMIVNQEMDKSFSRAQWLQTDAHGIHRHTLDINRAEDFVLNTYGMDEVGALREWNEEYQGVRESPIPTVTEKCLRSRAVYKILSDFQDAAEAGALAILDGSIVPINPMETEKAHVFVHNNIFYSFAVDSRDAFFCIGGDETAYKSSGHDVKNVVALDRVLASIYDSRSEQEEHNARDRAVENGLHTLATAVIDFMGARLVAQSLIPGILQCEQTSKLMYGAVDYTIPLNCDPELEEILDEIGKKLLIGKRVMSRLPDMDPDLRAKLIENKRKSAELAGALNELGYDHPGVPNEESQGDCASVADESMTIYSPVEWKGIKGAEGRKYMLDIVRVSPRDPNWVMDERGTGVKFGHIDHRKSLLIDDILNGQLDAKDCVLDLDPSEWREDYTASLRHELISLYLRKKVNAWNSAKEKESNGTASKKEGTDSTANEDENKEEETSSILEKGDGENVAGDSKRANTTEAEEQKPDNSNSDVTDSNEIKVEASEIADEKQDLSLTKEFESIDELIENFRLNTNVFMPYKAAVDDAQVKADEDTVRDIALYLWNDVLPSITQNIKRRAISPIDGENLTDALHQYGVNIRYIGRLAVHALWEEEEDKRAESQSKERRYQMPLYWLELLEIEMIARAIKHVVRDLFSSKPKLRSTPGPSIYRILNGLFGQPLAEEDSSTEAAAQSNEKTSRSSRGRFRRSLPAEVKDFRETIDRMGKVVVGTGLESVETDFAEIWRAINNHISFRFRYRLQLYRPLEGSFDEWRKSERISPRALLRRVCQRLGVHVKAKDYSLFRSKTPFDVTDITSTSPSIKSSIPNQRSPEASSLIDSAQYYFAAKNIQMAFQLTTQAIGVLNQVGEQGCQIILLIDQQLSVDGVHNDLIMATDMLAMILFSAQDFDGAIEQQMKSLGLNQQLNGLDSYGVINGHQNLSRFYRENGQIDRSLFHLRAYIYLLELCAGRNHVDLSNAYVSMGTCYQDMGALDLAQLCYAEGLGRSRGDRDVQAQVHHQIALLSASIGNYQQALERERLRHKLLKTWYGDSDKRVVESYNQVKVYLTAKVGGSSSDKDKDKEKENNVVKNEIPMNQEAPRDAVQSA